MSGLAKPFRRNAWHRKPTEVLYCSYFTLNWLLRKPKLMKACECVITGQDYTCMQDEKTLPFDLRTTESYHNASLCPTTYHQHTLEVSCRRETGRPLCFITTYACECKWRNPVSSSRCDTLDSVSHMHARANTHTHTHT